MLCSNHAEESAQPYERPPGSDTTKLEIAQQQGMAMGLPPVKPKGTFMTSSASHYAKSVTTDQSTILFLDLLVTGLYLLHGWCLHVSICCPTSAWFMANSPSPQTSGSRHRGTGKVHTAGERPCDTHVSMFSLFRSGRLFSRFPPPPNQLSPFSLQTSEHSVIALPPLPPSDCLYFAVLSSPRWCSQAVLP